MIFHLYSQWDVLIRAWGDSELVQALKQKLDKNAEVNHLSPPRFVEVEEIDHFPDRGRYSSVADVRATLTKTPTEHLRDAQEKARKSAFYETLRQTGLLL